MLSKPCAGKKSVEMIEICETSADHELITCFEHCTKLYTSHHAE